MSNMSYCRFENTLNSLRDCERAMGQLSKYPDGHGGTTICVEQGTETLSVSEEQARIGLVLLCHRIACEYAEDVM